MKEKIGNVMEQLIKAGTGIDNMFWWLYWGILEITRPPQKKK